MTTIADREEIPLRNELTSLEVAEDTVRKLFLDLLPQEVPGAIRQLEQASQELLIARAIETEERMTHLMQARARTWAKRFCQDQEWAFASALITLGTAEEANYGKGNKYEIVAVTYARPYFMPDSPESLEAALQRMAYTANPFTFDLTPASEPVDFSPGLERWKEVRAKALAHYGEALDAAYLDLQKSERWIEAQRFTFEELIPPSFTIEDVVLLIRHMVKRTRMNLEQLAAASPPLGNKSSRPTYQWVRERIDRIAPLLGFTRDRNSV